MRPGVKYPERNGKLYERLKGMGTREVEAKPVESKEMKARQDEQVRLLMAALNTKV